MSENNITRCPDGLGQLETGYRRENQLADWGLCGPQWPMVEQTSQDAKEVLLWSKNSVQYSSLSLSPTHLSHTTNITITRIKCERYIFIKCVRSFIEVRIKCLFMFLLIFVLRLYNSTNCRGKGKLKHFTTVKLPLKVDLVSHICRAEELYIYI